MGFFSYRTDIALKIHYEGAQAKNRYSQYVPSAILFDYNLPPKATYARHNTLTSMLILGHHKSKDLSSFLCPLVDELFEIGRGKSAFDAYSKSNFTLKLHAILLGVMHLASPYLYASDGSAIANLCGTKRSGNAKVPCRFCCVEREQDGPRGNNYVLYNTNHLKGCLNLRKIIRQELVKGVLMGVEEQKQRGISHISYLMFN